MRYTRWLLAMLALLTLTLLPAARPASAATETIYGDALGTGWADWSWATRNLANPAPVRSGSASISVTYSNWSGIQLHHAGLETNAFTKLRFHLHGGTAGGQLINLHVVYANGTLGPDVAITPPVANAWTEVQVSLTALNASNTTITGLVWQAGSAASQPTVYFDDIALIGDEDPNGPVLSNGALLPSGVQADGMTKFVAQVDVSDPQGLGDIASVTLDAAWLGRGTVQLRDDGRSNDGAAGDGRYGAAVTVAPGTASNERQLTITAQDQAAHRSTLMLGALAVLEEPGGSIPAGLPQRIGWGTNEWSDTSTDWQVASGVPWDYVYQYITYGWETWGDNFVGRFVTQAQGKGYIPVISVYLMLATPPECGESALCYATKLQNASAVNSYIASLQRAAQQAEGDEPVIFHLEPDFYGFMQQLSNSNDRPAHVQPDNPASYPVALNRVGYPNTLAGFGRYIVDMIHTTAPNVLVAPHASMWATNADPNNVTATEAITMARRTASFIDAMGGAQADLYFVEWSDRDSGSGIRPWWDTTNKTLPRPSRAILWESALSQEADKRLILWQIPVGNMSLDNTFQHYQDNRVAYIAGHQRDLVDAGVIAVLFGAGAEAMTHPSTDGGFLAAQAGIAYANPAAPTGLAATPGETGVIVRWNESTEVDRWGYRVSYQPSGGGATATIDVGRANAATLLLSEGSWSITVRAYDAMGNLSPASAPVIVEGSGSLRGSFLPLVR